MNKVIVDELVVFFKAIWCERTMRWEYKLIKQRKKGAFLYYMELGINYQADPVLIDTNREPETRLFSKSGSKNQISHINLAVFDPF